MNQYIKLSITSIIISWFYMTSFAQGQNGKFDPSKMMIGRLYGKVVDENKEPIPYATVQLKGKKFDMATKSLKDTLWAGMLTEDNGDFNLEKLPVIGEFDLVISFLGYAEYSQKVDFGIKMPGGAMPGQGNKPSTNMPTQNGGFGGFGGFGDVGNFDKDLGNIKLAVESSALSEVVITSQASTTSLALDRKSYKVDKDLTTAGGTAQDALKNVPSLSIDLDGNISLRNGAPQLFVDGKPTNLSLDQIPASSIESVEVITNPSAKYEAGGGVAGIVNIVLKKENRLGYNGNVRLGGDSQYGYNIGADINARGSKINVFGSIMSNYNKGEGEGETVRHNLFGNPFTDFTQINNNVMKGRFTNGRLGLDYFLDNRNTITFSGSYVRGKFNPLDNISTYTEYLYPTGTTRSSYVRESENNRNFRNLGLSLQYKHLYPKKGKELTADISFNKVKFMGGSDIITNYDTDFISLERQRAEGRGSFLTLQTDYVNPLNDKIKIESGLRATLRTNRNENMNFVFDNDANDWLQRSQLTDRYKFFDDVFGAYIQGSRQSGSWGIQAGLRAEGSYYKGELIDRDSSFVIAYPFSLFPSLFVTKKINESEQLQFAYTRRVLRPNFFQTMPFTDFSDSLNLRRGNPSLLPEFMNSIEVSYQKIFEKGHNILASLYFKQSSNTITSYLFEEFNEDLNKNVLITGYANGDKAHAYGVELTVKNNLFKRLDLTSNINVFQSKIDATNVEQELTINRTAAFFKETVQFNFGKGFNFQLNGEYKTKASFTPSTNNDSFRGGPGGGQNLNTAQGYTKDIWFADVSLSKSVLKNSGTITLSVQDVFASRKFGSYTSSDIFNQDTYRIMNPRLVRLNFAYRFGKMDLSLFKRKNNKINTNGNDMM
jgi:outer membrane receptor protein involved in Fe transport